MTIDFYDRNGKDFFDRTKDLDMTFAHEPFLALLPAGGHILDGGCGSGRDSKVFAERGYRVTAFDASETMVRLASENTGLPVLHMTFDDMTFENAFDGVWTCASLLHVPHAAMDSVFQKFIRALKAGGVWYLSFKVGRGEQIRGERLFSAFDEKSLREFIGRYPALELIQLWESADTRPELAHERWLNAFARKIGKED
jgi:SAM-dependent methyltransferase